MDSVTDSLENGFNAISLTNIIVALLIGGTIQQLVGSVKQMQLMIFSALINIKFHPVLLRFYQFCVYLAEFDVLNGPMIIGMVFSFIETEPFEEYFEIFGIGDMNFFNNVGSLPVMFVLIVANWMLWRVVFFLAKICYCSSCCLSLGLKSEKYKSLSRPLMKTGMDGFMDICMGSTLSMLMLASSPDARIFKIWFSSPSDTINSVATILLFLFCMLLPLRMWMVITLNFRRLDTKQFRDNYGHYIEGVKTKTIY